jgi:hypothetical protein
MSPSKLHVNIEQDLARLLGPITAVLQSEQLNISPATVLKSYKGGCGAPAFLTLSPCLTGPED